MSQKASNQGEGDLINAQVELGRDYKEDSWFTSGDELHPQKETLQGCFMRLFAGSGTLVISGAKRLFFSKLMSRRNYSRLRQRQTCHCLWAHNYESEAVNLFMSPWIYKICSYCHALVKLVSAVYDRVIAVRDNERPHFLQKGGCIPVGLMVKKCG